MSDQLKEALCEALEKWINTRPRVNLHDYNDAASRRADMRKIARHASDARILLGAVRADASITGEALLKCFERRLEAHITRDEQGLAHVRLSYTTGQCYWMEYRLGALIVLRSALWNRVRDGLPEEENMGRALRRHFYRIFGPRMAKQYFDWERDDA
jgi:hypothetical protein